MSATGASCDQVRPCISATSGAAYNPATGVITADISGTAGNQLALDGDGLYVPAVTCAQVRPCLSGINGVNYDPATGVISADVSSTVGNQLVLDPNGLFVPAVTCAQVRPCLSGINGVTYDPVTGVISADLSTDPGNALVLGTDTGLYVPPAAVDCTAVRACLSGINGVTYDPVTGVISADLSTDPGNTLVLGTDTGLYVPPVTCAQVRPCLSGINGVTYDPVTGVISADLSTDPGNALVLGTDTGLYVPPAAVDCTAVRACLSGINGVTYDPVTGVISADLSTDPGNTLVLGTDTGLYVPPAAVVTACGLTGDGTVATPLAAAVGAWPYPCSLDTEAGRVYCDASGVLRSEPRGRTAFVQDQQILTPAPTAVPVPQDTQVATHNLLITNPDPCRPAFVMIEGEVDADFTLPAGNSSAALGIATDEMSFVFNKGATAANDVHIQGTKVINATIPAGGNLNFQLSITMGRGSGGATYDRVQSFLRAFVFVL